MSEKYESESDDKIMAELAAQEIEGLTPRGRLAIVDLASDEQGSSIFLFLSLNSRIRELEKHIHKLEDRPTCSCSCGGARH